MIQLVYWCVWQIKKLKGQVGDLYTQIGGIISRGGGASTPAPPFTTYQQVYTNAGDPNGVVSVPHTYPAMCIDTTTNIIWTKTDGVISNTGWGSP